MGRFDQLLARWWRGAVVMTLVALAWIGGFLVAALAIYVLSDVLGLFEPSNWTYWITATLIAPYTIGASKFLSVIRNIWREADEAERLARSQRQTTRG